MTLRPGTRLGAYEVLAPLGAGGMGEVYRARDTRLGREVAIKVLPGELSSDAGRLKRFEKEARAASALNHPNIVTVYDLGTTEGVSWIAMEHVEGKTLRELLFGGALPIKKLLPIAAQIADGLAKAHEAGIVHRDLKPENVMVTKDVLVKILDFGLAKLTGPASGGDEGSHLPTETGTSPGMLVGTAGYMSPEQASGQRLDCQSDQFSFGSILYEMATGKRAFQKKTGVDTLAAVLNDEPERIEAINPQVSAPLRWVIERSLAKDPEGRYASTKDLARELAAIRNHLSEATPTSGSFAARSRRTSPRALAVLAVATLAALVAGGVEFGRRTAKIEPPVFRRLTFQRGNVAIARFTADGQTIVYGATWNGEPFRIFTTRRDGPESAPLPLPDAFFLSLSRSGELAMILGGSRTLARSPLSGGTPREILENVQAADWAPDSSNLLVVRDVGGKSRLEYPIGRVLHETTGNIRYPRISPRGDLAAFLDNPIRDDDSGSVAVVDREGRKRTLASGFTSSGGLAWSRDGKEVWFTASRAANAVSLFAVSLSGRERALLRTPAPMAVLDVAADGSVLIEQHMPSMQIAALAPGESRERDLSWLDFSLACDLSSDGRTLLFEESAAGAGDRYRLFLRRTDGSPPVRLFDGGCGALSADGRWALSVTTSDPSPQIVLVPTGTGNPTPIPREGLTPRRAWFFPDGKRLLILGEESGRGLRLYVKDLAGGPPRAITPEGVGTRASDPISPEGDRVLARRSEGSLGIYPAAGGEAKTLPGVTAGDRPLQWTSDGRGIFVMQRKGIVNSIFRIEVDTGRRTLWKEIAPSDPAGFWGIPAFFIAADEKSYVYSHGRTLAELYLVSGLK